METKRGRCKLEKERRPIGDVFLILRANWRRNMKGGKVRNGTLVHNRSTGYEKQSSLSQHVDSSGTKGEGVSLSLKLRRKCEE